MPKPLHFRHAAVARDRRPPEADVAKATFCKHFPAKADLIVASIAAAEAAGRKALPALDQPEPLTAGAEALIALARWPDSLGCRFQFPVAEHAAKIEPGQDAHVLAVDLDIKGDALPGSNICFGYREPAAGSFPERCHHPRRL